MAVYDLTHTAAEIDATVDVVSPSSGNMYLKNTKYICGKNTNDVDLTLLGINSANQVNIAYGNVDALTNIYGKAVAIHYGTRTQGILLNTSGNVGIGVSPTTKLHVNGVVKCTSVDTSSDETLKNKVGDIDISIEDIAAAPNVTFTWKEGEDTEDIHGGTYAQYWEKVTPYYVHGKEGDKALDYGSLAVSCAIELAKEVVALKDENAKLKKELAEIREMIS